jgi:hypothetical protein
VFDKLIADAKTAFATGKLKPGRKVYFSNSVACVIGAAWALHHEYRPPQGERIGHWAMEYYKLPRPQIQGFVHGWDGSGKEDESEGYLEGYAAGEKAALDILGA